MRYIPCPSHSRFYHPHNIGWAVQITKLLIMKFSPPPLPHPSYALTFSWTLHSQTPPSLRSSLVSAQVSRPYKTTCKITVLTLTHTNAKANTNTNTHNSTSSANTTHQQLFACFKIGP
jgi:hypothetical protein